MSWNPPGYGTSGPSRREIIMKTCFSTIPALTSIKLGYGPVQIYNAFYTLKSNQKCKHLPLNFPDLQEINFISQQV